MPFAAELPVVCSPTSLLPTRNFFKIDKIEMRQQKQWKAEAASKSGLNLQIAYNIYDATSK